MSTGLPKYYVLDKRVSNAETTINKLFNEIYSMKCDLHLLKKEAIISGPPINYWLRQKRLLEIKKTTKSLAQQIEDDKRDVFVGKKPKIAFDKENGYVVVYTDGVSQDYLQKESKAGIGVWFGDNHPLNVGKPCPGPRQTKGAAEIYATVEACKLAGENGIDKLKIYTHAAFAIEHMKKWRPGWKKMSWKEVMGKNVTTNDELLEMEKFSKALKDVKYVHLERYPGIKKNEAANKLAIRGAFS